MIQGREGAGVVLRMERKRGSVRKAFVRVSRAGGMAVGEVVWVTVMGSRWR